MPSKRKELINPVRVFFAIVIAAIIWFAPIAKTPKQAARVDKPTLLEYAASPGLILAVPEAEAGCPSQCEIQVCVDWDPTPCGSNSWDIGCCLAYDTGCDPECDMGGGGGGGGENQPPAISHVLTCTQPGANGWCMGNLSLDLTASDPQGSQVIISGDVNGIAFACPVGATTCAIPLSEGAGNANYRADAATTGLFATGTTTYLLDSSTPQLNGSVSGVVGTGGWYKSNVTLSVISSDLVSGIASTTVTVDGGPQTVYSAPIVLTDGVHTVALSATDNAGHVTQTTQSFNIDTVTPVLNISLSGSMGLNNWYISNVTITSSASDSGSGLASLEATIDGGSWTVVNGPLSFTDGVHSYQFRATDNAGNITESGQTLNIDTTTPALNLTTAGTTGLNGWYRSAAQITALGTDATSGVAKIEVSTNGGAFLPYTAPVIVNDGQHNYQFKVTDNAGNVTQTVKAVKVDTVTPSLSLNLSGTRGQNDWYVSSTSVTPTATDVTSGIASLEISQDGFAYAAYQSTSFFDGLHTYRFKATDNAGNITETPAQNLKVDTIAPVIEMMDELKLGEYLYYDLEDPTVTGQENSGLSIYRAVIEDDDEKYKKIVWLDGLAGDKKRDSILWDGKFADGAQAGWGEYFITLKISDAAGNERMRTAIVKVGLLSFLEEIPAFTPPQTTTLPAQTTQANSAAATEFGGTNSAATGESTSESTEEGGANNAATGAESASISAGGTAVFNSETDYVQSGFSQGNQSTFTPITNTNILWGAVAAATLGATLADWQRRREEEEARKRAEAAAREEEGGRSGKKKTPGQIAFEKMMKQKHIVGESQALLNEKAREKEEQAEKTRQNLIAKNEDRAPVDMAKVNQLVQQAVSQQAQDEYRAGEREYAVSQAIQPPPKWWENVIGWADTHQPVMSILTGIGVGIIAVAGTIAVVGTAAITLPIVAVVAGAALLTSAVLAGTGTIALNSYFDRPLTTNLPQNALIAAGTALIISGGALALVVGCSTPVGMPFCAAAVPAIDAIEQVSLQVQYAYQVATGDPQAGETYIELQFEQNDGGAPGNTLVNEASEQLAKLSPDALELVSRYGDEAIPLLLKYGDDAVDIIGAYGDEGIALLTLYGDDAIDLITTHGTPAVDLMMTYGDDAINLYQAGNLPLNNIAEIIPEDHYDDVIATFENPPSAITLSEDLIVYRYWGGSSPEVGNWVALDPNLTPQQARELLALPDTSSAINVTQFTIPADTTIVFGEAREQILSDWAGPYATGGGLQIYIPNSEELIYGQ